MPDALDARRTLTVVCIVLEIVRVLRSDVSQDEQIRENLLRDDESPHQGPPEVRMIGDFDDSANALWTLYGKEAKSHDEASIQALKDDMDGVLIFVRLYSVFPIHC